VDEEAEERLALGMRYGLRNSRCTGSFEIRETILASWVQTRQTRQTRNTSFSSPTRAFLASHSTTSPSPARHNSPVYYMHGATCLRGPVFRDQPGCTAGCLASRARNAWSQYSCPVLENPPSIGSDTGPLRMTTHHEASLISMVLSHHRETSIRLFWCRCIWV
jgi:hypothetical protein